MPEGHTIHREARLQQRHFGSKNVRVSSPQGRFEDGAAVLDGLVLDTVDAWGKHLFYEWSEGPLLHVHLGLFGRFRHHGANPPGPTEGTRMAVTSGDHTVYLSGPTICDLTDDEGKHDVIDQLGPDPLRAEHDSDDAVAHIHERLGRRTVPIAQSLLDQAVVAGLGNVYRSEVLFRTGIHPLTPSRGINEEQVNAIWGDTVEQLRLGERSGRIVTTEPAHVGRDDRSSIKRGERTYVYKRMGQPCRRCGTEIVRDELAARKVWWCPTCQAP
jgi:endonuclease-8